MILMNFIIKVTTIILTIFFTLSSFSQASIGSVSKENKKEILNKIHSLQIPFVENKGQIKYKSVKYYAKTFGGNVYITNNGQVVYSLPKINAKNEAAGWVIRESFIGASISNVDGEDKTVTKVSYLKGKDPLKGKSNIPTYRTVNLREIYDGIELKLKAYGNNIEKLFYVTPGASPERIKVKLDGAKSLKVNEQRELEVETGLGMVKFTKPVAYQENNGKRKFIEVAYELKGNQYKFKTGDYDRTKELIIDPLLASTFLGGTYSDYVNCITQDDNGYIYVAGVTDSIDMPVTVGSYDTTYNGGEVAFISKFDSNLQNLLASTFLDSNSMVHSIAIDNTGNVYVAGATGNDVEDFRTDTDWYGTSSQAFILKFDSNLQNLLASKILQGSGGKEIATALSIDSSENVYVTGLTNSSDFPVTLDAYDTTYESYSNGWDVFITKLDSNLQNLLASTFLGGSTASGESDVSYDFAYSISTDSSGNVFVIGATASLDFPVTAGAFDITHSGSLDVFITKFDSNLENLLASSFIGGTYEDYGMAHIIDNEGNIYVTGVTFSVDFPTKPNAYDKTYNGYEDVFLVKLDNNLSTLSASTFLGGSDDYGGDKAYSIALDSSGNVYVAGSTHSSDFPTTPGAFDNTLESGNNDAFVAKFSNNLQNLLNSTVLGIAQHYVDEKAFAITLDSSGNVYVVGATTSSDYPTTVNSFDTIFNGGNYDAFISKLDSNLSAVYSDKDKDGYTSDVDCDDNNPTVSPRATEGPYGNATCSDTLDNDCDGLTDGADYNCQQHTITVNKAGSGEGTVSTSDKLKLINCGTDCSEPYPISTKPKKVTLKEKPDANSYFAGWAGDCAAAGTKSSCTLTMDSDKNATANFLPNPTLTLTKSGDGKGNVKSAPKGIDCGVDCATDDSQFKYKAKVTLKAKADQYSTFLGWSGDACSGTTKPTCKVSMDASKNVTAQFGLPDISVSPAEYNFGDVKIKTLSQPVTFTITNNGIGDLKITKMEITGTDAKMFKKKGGGKKTIKPGASLDFSVTFKPTTTGEKTATLRITSTDPDEPIVEIPLSGGGIE